MERGLRAIELLSLGMLAGACNQVFGIDQTMPADAISPPDAFRLLVPPDAGADCPPPPSFSTWSHAPHTVAGTTGIIHPTFLSSTRVVFVNQGLLYETGLDGPPTKINELDKFIYDPSSGPAGDVLWYARAGGIGSAGLYFATRSNGTWTATPTFFGLLGEQIEVGPAAFYDGTVRMVVMFQRKSTSPLTLVELSSADGLTWMELATLPWSKDDYDPALSADGCTLLFVHDYPGGADLDVAHRETDGTFAPPALVTGLSSPTATETQPALDPTNRRLWYFQDGALIEALAP